MRADEDVVDAVVVGAGFAGMYMLHRLREAGRRARVIEAGGDVGGTWYWNRYPGARCDIESMEYSYQFSDELQQEWEWSERYATQPEILRYAGHVADRFDLRRDISFDTRVVSATFDEAGACWRVQTDAGDDLAARFLIMATGCLSATNVPDFAGRDEFAGRTFHTGRWPHEPVDFSGERVGVIGTGSSGLQLIPIVAEQAHRLTVFQRTPTYAVPAHNRALEHDEVQAIKDDYGAFRRANRQMMPAFGARWPSNEASATQASERELEEVFEQRWSVGGLTFLGAFSDLMLDPAANELAAEFVRRKIRETVDDPAVAELLSPTTAIGCKRLCVDTGYYATFNRPDVALVDVRGETIEITPDGVRIGSTTHELDSLIFATGFDAMTGSLDRIEITGRGGRTLREHWTAGPRTYLGLGVAGFPNLFLITGPGSPSVLTNMLVAIEQHVEWIDACISHLDGLGLDLIEATGEGEEEWVAHVNAVADLTVYPRCNSWYLGANVPGKPRIFMPLVGFPPYEQLCDAVAADGYRGFVLGRAAERAEAR